MKSILYNSKLCVCAVLSVVVFFLTLTVSNAALRGQPGGGITMEPQDAFVVPGNQLQLIAYFKPYGQTTYFGIWVNYKWDFQAASGASQTVVKSGTWHGGTPFELLIPNATAGHAGKYRITFNNEAGGDVVQSRWAIVTVGGAGTIVTPITPVTPPVMAPSVTRQPQSQTATAGTSVTWSVIATGTAPLRYQWRKSGVNISGATSASYAIGNVQSSHAGSYMVVVSNEGGSTSSSSAVLTVTAGVIPLPGAYNFTTLAGSAGSSGNIDGTGSVARFNSPEGVAVDSASNVYVVDTYNNAIRKITPNGVVSTLAGLALRSGSADGTGSAARFSSPTGITVDGGSNVYVADWGNNTIRKITPGGVVSTLAGLAGSLGSADGTGSAARFGGPRCVAVDNAVNVYVADIINSTIRKITPGGTVSTLAGLAGSLGSANGTGSTARFNGPYGVGVDTVGNVYVADRGNNTIRKITPAGVVSTLAGLVGVPGSTDGTGSAARFDPPNGVAMDITGNVYVSVSDHTIRKITPGGVVSTLAGLAGSLGSADGTGSAARFNNPYGVAVDGVGNVYVADTDNNTIRKGVPPAGGANTPPTITSQPLSQTVVSATNVTFTVTAIGTAPLNYQWRKEGVNLADSGRINGANTATLTIASVQSIDSGNYTVVVSNSSLSVTSVNGVLVVNPATGTTKSVAGDVNSDGRSDLLFQDANGFLAAWMMNGSSLVSASFLTPNKVGDLSYRIAATGDFNRDGKDDVLFQHSDGTLAVWFMNGTSQINTSLLDPSNPGSRNWRVVGAGDLNSDGKTDLVFQHTDGTLAVWYLDGIKLSSAVLFSPANPSDARWKVVGVGDFNADGKQDLVFQHDDGTLAVWFLNGAAMTKASLFNPSNPGAAWHVVSVADRNQDGKPDLLFQHTNLDLAVWFMDGTKFSSSQLLNPKNSGGTWKVVAPK